MTEYTFSEARQKLASILDKARRDGAVRIRRRDGQVFVLKPERAQKSPLDVSGINLKIGRMEIVDLIKEGRRKVDAG
jgi:antitoxin Phd